MSILEINNITKSFSGNKVLKGISLNVDKGEVVAIIGASGGGKSTLLRCATTLETIDSGSIKICGDTLCETAPNGKVQYCDKRMMTEIRSKFGMVFQNYNLFPHFTVRKNITEALIHVHKMNQSKADEICYNLLEKMGLTSKAGAYPGSLSGGQQQRVSIARALATSPEILFFDEPTSALDPQLTQEVLKVIRELAEEKMTMVIVTHEMSFARDVADRVVFVNDGVIVEDGPAREVIEHPKNELTKRFLSIKE